MRILLIEDDTKIVKFLEKGFQQAGFMTEHAGNGRLGLAMAVATPYDCAIVDLMLPEMDGLSVIDNMRRKKVNTPVIILSAKRTLDDRIRGLERGSDDYLTKPFAFSELLARVQALIRRSNKVVEASSLEVGDLAIDLLARTVCRGGKSINLQPKEFALLEYLMRNAGRVVSKTMIMERVWDYSFDPQTNVVEARVCRLRDKVDKGFDTRLIHTVRGLGYVLRKDDDTTT